MNSHAVLPDSSDQHGSLNYRVGILHRALAELGKTLADPSVVLALLVRQLSGSNLLVGLLSTIRYGGWFLPQLFVAGLIQHRPRKGPTYVKAELARCAGYGIIAVVILIMPHSNLLLPVFFGLFALSYLAHGVGSVPNFDVIGKAIPVTKRGPFFARANLWGGIMAFGAGFLVRTMLSEGEGISPPIERYALLILLSAAFLALAALVFRGIREPILEAGSKPVTWMRHLRQAPALLARRGDYRRLVGTLVFMTVAQRLADPFYIIYATEVLHVPVSMAGLYLSALVFSKILSNLLWDYLSRRRESPVTLQLSAAASLAVPVVAVLIGALMVATRSSSLSQGTLPGYAFVLVFLLMGVRDSGKHIGKRSVLLDVVPAEERPTYWGLLNTMLGIVSLLPVLAGKLIDWAGFQSLFGLVAALALMGWWISHRLGERTDLAE